jgi:hypothetical protein
MKGGIAMSEIDVLLVRIPPEMNNVRRLSTVAK